MPIWADPSLRSEDDDELDDNNLLAVIRGWQRPKDENSQARVH